MGVIRDNKRRNTLSTSADEDSLHHLLNEIANLNPNDGHGNNHQQEDDDNSNNNDLNAAAAAEISARDARRYQRKMERKAAKNSPRPEPTFRGLGCRGKSNRKNRRFENGNHLLAQSFAAAGFDADFASLSEEIDIYDFVPHTVSAFAHLLMEKESMRAWNEFIAQSEEDQQVFLKHVIDEYREEQAGHRDDGDNDNNGKQSSQQRNAASHHPAFSPDLSFARIDDKLKKILRKTRRIPLNLLERMEEEVSDFFESAEDPSESIYKSCLPSGFQRMLLQATSQYLNLVCKSFNQNGMRWSKVVNENESGFSRPAVKLARYLETSIRKPQRGREAGFSELWDPSL